MREDLGRRINLLSDFIKVLETDSSASPRAHRFTGVDFNMIPSEEWQQFVNVYHIHCPAMNLNDITRNVSFAVLRPSHRHIKYLSRS
jgi:hypothetical protein